MTTHQPDLPATATAIAALAPTGVDHADAFVAIDLPVAPPTGHDLLVEVRAVSVNPVDVKVRAGFAAGQAPKIVGYDAAGVVAAVGEEVTTFAPGDEVFYAGSIARAGSNQELQLVDSRIVGRKPASLDFAQAAAVPLTAITAWEALFERLGLTETTTGTLLVVGAAGGVGSMAVQLAAARTGVTIVGTASRPESQAWVTELGAHHTVHPDRLVEEVGAIAPQGVDWILSAYTSGRGADLAAVLRPFGELVPIDELTAADIMAFKGKSQVVRWELMFTNPLHVPGSDSQHRLLDAVADLIDAGTLRTTVSTVLTPFDAERLREAHRLVETSRTIGKVVVAR